MIALWLLAAIPGYAVDGELPSYPQTCGSSYTRDECVKYYRARNLICASRETQNISDWDPALAIFQSPRESLKDAKVDLAVERVNGCDFPGKQEQKRHAH